MVIDQVEFYVLATAIVLESTLAFTILGLFAQFYDGQVGAQIAVTDGLDESKTAFKAPFVEVVEE